MTEQSGVDDPPTLAAIMGRVTALVAAARDSDRDLTFEFTSLYLMIFRALSRAKEEGRQDWHRHCMEILQQHVPAALQPATPADRAALEALLA